MSSLNNIIPVVSSNFMYMNGLQVNRVDNSKLVVSFGQCRDSTNTYDISIPSDKTLNVLGPNGVNGLDQGSIAADSWYGVYAISGLSYASPTGLLLSLASNAVPLMPFGYNAYRLIDFWKTDLSSNFVQMYTSGNNGVLTKMYSDLDGTVILLNGHANTITNLSLDAVIPPYNYTEVKLSVKFISGAANDNIKIGVPGSVSAIQLASLPLNSSLVEIMDVIPQEYIGIPNITYNLTAASDTATIKCIGYKLVM